MAHTFHGFKRLPQELRRMIWEFHLNEERVVTIDHHFYSVKGSSLAKTFEESLPALLHVCRESRELALPRYTSVFPQPGSQSWTYTGSQEFTALRDILSILRLPQRGTVTDMVEFITTHMNQHPLDWARYMQFADGPKVVRYPLWFNAQRDILLFKPNVFSMTDAYFSLHLTSPEQSIVMDRIRYLAIELDCFCTLDRLTVYEKDSTIRRLRGGITMPALQQLTFLVKGSCEVNRFSFDTSESLGNTNLTFALDLDSKDYQDDMKEKWSNVTWDITLPKTNQVTDLWQAALAWCRALKEEWPNIKKAVTEGLSEVDQTWRNEHRTSLSPHHVQSILGKLTTDRIYKGCKKPRQVV